MSVSAESVSPREVESIMRLAENLKQFAKSDPNAMAYIEGACGLLSEVADRLEQGPQAASASSLSTARQAFVNHPGQSTADSAAPQSGSSSKPGF